MDTNMSWDLPTKTRWRATMLEHQEFDRIIQGNWLSGKDDSGIFRGCFFGCAMQTDILPLEKAIVTMNLPSWLIHLAERIFEGLPAEEAKLFPVQLIDAIPTDTDLTGVECDQHISRLDRLLNLSGLPDNAISAINGVKDCWMHRLGGAPESDIPWSKAAEARAALWSAKAAEARAALWSAKAAEEEEAAYAALWSARAEEEEEAEAAWKVERDTLISLLIEAGEEL